MEERCVALVWRCGWSMMMAWAVQRCKTKQPTSKAARGSENKRVREQCNDRAGWACDSTPFSVVKTSRSLPVQYRYGDR